MSKGSDTEDDRERYLTTLYRFTESDIRHPVWSDSDLDSGCLTMRLIANRNGGMVSKVFNLQQR